MYIPTAEKDFISPDHGEREQLVELLRWEVLYVPQDKFPPGLPVLVTLPIAPICLSFFGYGSVLLNKILHVQVRHLGGGWCGFEKVNIRSGKRMSEVEMFSTATSSGQMWELQLT